MGKNTYKLLKAVDLLSKPQGVTINELAENLNIDKRSVFRLIKLIEDFGFPLYSEQAPTGRQNAYKIEASFLKKLPNMTIPDVSLTLSEIIALYLLKSEERVYKGTDIEKALNTAFAKIGLFAPAGLFDKLNRIKTLFVSPSKHTKDYTGKEEIIDSLTEAMLAKKRCRIKYHSFGKDEVKEFNIDPLHFFENNGGLYLFVKIQGFDDIRTLAVERIIELTITGEAFKYPAGFEPDETLDSAFGIVYDDPIEAKIWFSADQARYIKERKWAKEQKITDQADGSIIIEIKTSGSWDVKKWVLSFGAEAKLLEPKELREEIMGELKATERNYALESD